MKQLHYDHNENVLAFNPASPKKQILTEKGASPQILIPNHNETATDALGRKLVTHKEAGFPKKDKYVGLFYLIWTDSVHGFSTDYDVTKAYACDPEKPSLGNHGAFCWWAEPETGYHVSDDVWQIKRDMRYFAMAGIDFIYLDFTNGYIYEKSLRALLDTCLELRAAGQMTPYIVPWALAEADRNAPGYGLVDIYEMFYKDERYADLWFYWEGKPLAMLKNDGKGGMSAFDSKELTDFFTFRISWPGYAWPGEEVGSGYKFWGDGWLANFQYFYGYTDDPQKSECVGIGGAGFATPGSGRSGHTYSQRQYLDRFLETTTMGEGIMLQENFEEMLQKNPETDVLIISRWNEWGAQNLNLLDFGFCDQFNREYSRDIEPMKGGYTDNYFYQMCNIIRRFKGVLPPDTPSGKQTVDPNGSFDQWQSVTPVFWDFEGDTEPRDEMDVTHTFRYQNFTGRNDIVESRITADEGMIYAYAKTAAPITSYKEGKNWMLLFFDSDNNKSTGWEGYDFVVNYDVIDDTTTTLCAYKDGIWQEIGVVKYQVKDNEFMVAIPRSLLGLTNERFMLYFHWMDNVTDVYDLLSWFTTGDSAPERRNNYTITLSIPYDATVETILPARVEGVVSYMPAACVSETNLQAGLRATLYALPENYGKMPDFEHIVANAQNTCVVSEVSLTVAGERMNDFALAFEGYVLISEDGVYDFPVQVNDGARLYIDGRLVTKVMNGITEGVDKTPNALGALRLAKGYHAIKIEYANIGGGYPKLAFNKTSLFYC
ncbi:MAG: hypothetical protein J6D87_07035 [Clostridia bacterium]|nr:hypothetical protein [Clostridia bacterium]